MSAEHQHYTAPAEGDRCDMNNVEHDCVEGTPMMRSTRLRPDGTPKPALCAEHYNVMYPQPIGSQDS